MSLIPETEGVRIISINMRCTIFFKSMEMKHIYRTLLDEALDGVY